MPIRDAAPRSRPLGKVAEGASIELTDVCRDASFVRSAGGNVTGNAVLVVANTGTVTVVGAAFVGIEQFQQGPMNPARFYGLIAEA